jgi:hypothetical protein
MGRTFIEEAFKLNGLVLPRKRRKEVRWIDRSSRGEERVSQAI